MALQVEAADTRKITTYEHLPTTEEEVLAEARRLLIGQFALSDVPLTGKSVSCVLETTDGQLFPGHNTETENPVTFYHAEADALDSLHAQVGNAAIGNVYIAGAVAQPTGQQLKHIAPCPDCYTLLEPRLSPDARLILFGTPNDTGHTILTADEYRPAYAKWPYSAIGATDKVEILEELQMNTPLNEKDREIVAELRLLGLQEGISFYLTGSSSGRGWISSTLHKKLGTSYGDMDILAITEHPNKLELRAMVMDIIGEQYGAVEAVETDTDYWVVCGNKRNSRRHVTYDSYFADTKKVMDFLCAPTLEEGMLRDDYYANNYYHKIS